MENFFRCRRVSMLSGALAPLVLLLSVSSATGGVAGATSSSAGAGHRGGILTIAVGTNPATLNSDVTDSTSILGRMWYDDLFNLNGKEEPVPALATSYKESKNGLTYTFYLRHGVKWSDGVPFTSKDVVFTLEKFLSLRAEIPKTVPGDITSIKAVGTYEVTVQLKEPYAPFVSAALPTFFIMPEHVYGNKTPLNDSAANDLPVGTGPFMVKQWVPNQKIVLVRNPHYWGATKKNPVPWFKEVVIDIITNPQTIVDGLLSGTIDYIPTSYLPTTDIKEIQQSSCCRAVLIHSTPGYDIMYTNTTRAPFNNLAVRRAVYMAITRKLIVQDALSGYGKLPLAPIPPTYGQLYTPKINLMKQYPYDPAKAAKMLDNAGFPVKSGERFGKSITLLYSTNTGTFASETAKIVKADLAKITIKVNLIVQDITTWATETYVKKNYTLSFIGLTSENDPALGIKRAFACQPAPTSEFTNASGFCTSEVTSLFHQGVVATSTAGRQRAYAKVQKILDSKLPSYELGWRTTYVAVSKKIQNWQASLLSWGGSFDTTWADSWFK